MGYDMCQVGGEAYYRLNIWGMGPMRGILHEAGLLDVEAQPQFPERPEGTEHEDSSDTENPELIAYAKACEAALGAAGSAGKVPAFKFGSNDGWLVTAEECRFLAKGLNKVTEQQISDGISGEMRYRGYMDKILALTGAGKDLEEIDREEVFESVEVPKADPDQIADWRSECDQFAAFCEECASTGGFQVF